MQLSYDNSLSSGDALIQAHTRKTQLLQNEELFKIDHTNIESEIQRLALYRAMGMESQMFYSRYMFRACEESPMLINWHHWAICQALDLVVQGRIQNLIINISPGYTKTVLAVLQFISRGYAINRRSRFIHLSYSSDLAIHNSMQLKEVIECQPYQQLYDVQIKQDSKANKRWNVTNGGGLVASSINGTVTGFRAGTMQDGFTGAIVIDDPIKPKDAFSMKIREDINKRFPDTIRNRKALPKVPVILIMQRLDYNDLSGFLLRGGSGDLWHHLMLPQFIGKDSHLIRGASAYPEEYTHGIPLIPQYAKVGPLWAIKGDKAEQKKLKKTPYVYQAQSQQHPEQIEGKLIKKKWLCFYTELPRIRRLVIITDTASEAKTLNDRTAIQVWGLGIDGKAYLIDYTAFRLEIPDIEQQLFWFWDKYRQALGLPAVACVLVEKKGSGHGIIQTLKRKRSQQNRSGLTSSASGRVIVFPVPRSTDKVSRVMATASLIIGGQLMFPAKGLSTQYKLWDKKDWNKLFDEVLGFASDLSHPFDDQVDCICDAGQYLITDAASFLSTFGHAT